MTSSTGHPLRVLFLYPYGLGSVASFVRPANIIKRLLGAGMKVTLATVSHRSEADSGINLSVREFPYLRQVPQVRLRSERGALLANTLTINRLLVSHDIVHFQKCHPTISIPAVLASVLKQKPVHYDWDDNETGILRRVAAEGRANRTQICTFSILERRLVKLVDTISVASSRLRAQAIEWGAREDYLFDAPVGADLSLFSPEEVDSSGQVQNKGGPTVLYQGQLEEASFAEDFIKCAVKVLSKRPDVNFLIVGGGVRLKPLKDLASSAGVPIRFTGYVSHREVASCVRAADVCVATFEDNEVTRCKSPLKIAEYMASGKAIVASDVGDVPRMVSDCGLLVPPGDVEALADSVLRCLGDQRLRKSLGDRARERAESLFNWDATAENIMGAYEKALSDFGRPVVTAS